MKILLSIESQEFESFAHFNQLLNSDSDIEITVAMDYPDEITDESRGLALLATFLAMSIERDNDLRTCVFAAMRESLRTSI